MLDLILSSDPDLVSNVEVISELGNSDHNMVSFDIRFGCVSYRKNRLLRNYKCGDYKSMRAILTSVDWDKFMDGSVDDCRERFRDFLFNLTEQYVLLKETRSSKLASKPVDD